jgi:hypothetical protein
MFAKEAGSTCCVESGSQALSGPNWKSDGISIWTEGGRNRSFNCGMTHYRVFLGAPSRAEMRQSSGSYQWQTVSSEPSLSASVIFPPATLEAASRRISLIYQGVIFKEPDEGDDVDEKMDLHGNGETSS